MPTPRKMQRNPAGPTTQVENRPNGLVRQLLPNRKVGPIASALNFMPDDRRISGAICMALHRQNSSVRPREESTLCSFHQRGIGRQGEETPRRVGQGAVQRPLDLRLDDDRVLRPAGVLEPQRHLRRPRAGAGDAADGSGQQLEVGVPDPGDVAPVGDPVVEGDPEVEAAAVRLEPQRPQDLVGAGRVLDQQDRDRLLADRDRLDPAERAPRRGQRRARPAPAAIPSSSAAAIAARAL